MLRKILVIVAITAISVFCLNGCKKRPSEAESEEETFKTMTEYEVEARKQINKENMAEELKSIEKAMEQELSEPR